MERAQKIGREGGNEGEGEREGAPPLRQGDLRTQSDPFYRGEEKERERQRERERER